MRYRCRVPAPHLGEDDRPDTHEDGVEHGGGVIEQIFGLSHQTGNTQLVEVTELITARTHCRVSHLLADIHSWHVTGVSTANNIQHQSRSQDSVIFIIFFNFLVFPNILN